MRARAWKPDAVAAAARVRLNAIEASTSQALFAANDFDGQVGQGAVLGSAMTCSMMGGREFRCDGVELADVTERERPNERAQRRGATPR